MSSSSLSSIYTPGSSSSGSDWALLKSMSQNATTPSTSNFSDESIVDLQRSFLSMGLSSSMNTSFDSEIDCDLPDPSRKKLSVSTASFCNLFENILDCDVPIIEPSSIDESEKKQKKHNP